jgi:hypothetical protein
MYCTFPNIQNIQNILDFERTELSSVIYTTI